jgi:uncharacterized membrane protein
MEVAPSEFIEYIALAIEAMAVILVAYASVEAFIGVIRLAFGDSPRPQANETYVRYLRWLVGALTFQLAADIVHTSIAPSWEELGQVGAIAVIRTFLSYFAARDVREATEEHEVEVERAELSVSPARVVAASLPD